jgi:NAD(P) transhydrogenase subunit alpha
MKIAVPAEADTSEARVAATPETVKKFRGLGVTVAVEAGAGTGSDIPDPAFRDAGATVAKTLAGAVGDADVVLTVRRPSAEQVAAMKAGTVIAGQMDPFGDVAGLEAMAKAGLTVFALELMPRITRAQTMDVLSSQSNLAGYKAVIDAAATYGRAMPMMMTAAGTVAPAKVFIMGAGVAGLQAIATARRLGAIVTATDVRPAAKEQVASLGAKFIAVEDDEFREAETAGGYAKEMSAEYREKQRALVAEHVTSQDIIITTALIPGRPAPELISRAMVESMKPGSVIVDLAVERGGNCAVSRPGKVVRHKGVTVIGHLNVAGRLAADASSLYARNVFNFFQPLIDGETGALKIDFDDEIVAGTLIARDGALVHPMLKTGDKP